MTSGERHKKDGVLGLAHETADALGRLTVLHLRLARLEIKSDLRAMTRQAGLIVVLIALAMIGYGLALAGLAVLLGGSRDGGFPMLVIGVAHVGAAGIGILVAVMRLRRIRPMDTTAGEVNRSLAPLEIGSAAASDELGENR